MSQLTDEQQKRIEDYLEGRLQGEDCLRLEKWLAENPAGQEYKIFLEKLAPLSVSNTPVKPPAYLVDKIMSQIKRPYSASNLSFPWAKAGLAFVGLLLVVFAGFQRVHFQNSSGSRTAFLNVPFVLNAPGARQVELAGDFSGWKKIPLKQEGGMWKVQLPVSIGQDNQYVFILNGRVMVIDPDNPRVIRDKNGDFYSVIHPNGSQTKDLNPMRRTVFLKTAGPLLVTAFWVGILSPSPAEAETISNLSLQIHHDALAAGWAPSQIQPLVEEARQLEAKGLPDKTIEMVVEQTLPLGRGPVLEKTLNRLGLLVSEGLSPEGAGKVVVKEAQSAAQAADAAMEKSLEAGLRESLSKSHSASVKVLTQAQIEEKLEQKRQEWEDQMEQEKEIEFIQHENSEHQDSKK